MRMPVSYWLLNVLPILLHMVCDAVYTKLTTRKYISADFAEPEGAEIVQIPVRIEMSIRSYHDEQL